MTPPPLRWNDPPPPTWQQALALAVGAPTWAVLLYLALYLGGVRW